MRKCVCGWVFFVSFLVMSIFCNAQDVRYGLDERCTSIVPPAWPSGWTIENTNGDSQTWETWEFGGSQGGTCFRYLSDAVNPADDWFFSPAIPLSAGTEYTLALNLRVTSTGSPHDLTLWYGGGAASASMTTTVLTLAGISNEEIDEVTATFTVPGTGDTYLGIHCSSPLPNSLAVFVDDIRISSPETDLEVHLQLDKAFYATGAVDYATDEEKKCLVYVENVGSSSQLLNSRLTVGDGDDPDAVLSFLITDPDGFTVPFEAAVKRAEPETEDFESIVSGEQVYKNYDLNAGVFDFLRSGDYTLQAIYQNRFSLAGQAVWMGRIESDPVILTIQ